MNKWYAYFAAVLAAAAGVEVGAASAASTPVGVLPKGPVSITTTKPGQLVAVALPRAGAAQGYVWRIAPQFDSSIVREVSEADVGANVVVVFRVVGRGKTAVVFGMTRGDTSPKAIKALTFRIAAA